MCVQPQRVAGPLRHSLPRAAIIYSQQYRRLATDVSGSVRLLLFSVNHNSTIFAPGAKTTYCTGGYGPSPLKGRFPCLYFDESQLVFPELENAAMFVATRVTRTDEALFVNGVYSPNCSSTDPDCDYARVGSPVGNSTYYIAGPVEMSTISIGHAVYAPSIKKEGWSKTAMTGRIVGGLRCQAVGRRCW